LYAVIKGANRDSRWGQSIRHFRAFGIAYDCIVLTLSFYEVMGWGDGKNCRRGGEFGIEYGLLGRR
jgi:hypothetical protein